LSNMQDHGDRVGDDDDDDGAVTPFSRPSMTMAHQSSDFTLASLSVSIGNLSVTPEGGGNENHGSSIATLSTPWDASTPTNSNHNLMSQATPNRRNSRRISQNTTLSTDSFKQAVGNILSWVKKSNTTLGSDRNSTQDAVMVPPPPPNSSSYAAPWNGRPSTPRPPLSSDRELSSRQGSLGNMSVIVSSRGELFYDLMQVDSLTSISCYDDDLDGNMSAQQASPLESGGNNGPQQQQHATDFRRSNAVRQLVLETGTQLSTPNGAWNPASATAVADSSHAPSQRSTRRISPSNLSVQKLSDRELNHYMKEASLRSVDTSEFMMTLDDDGTELNSWTAQNGAETVVLPSNDDVVYYKLIWQNEEAATAEGTLPVHNEEDDDNEAMVADRSRNELLMTGHQVDSLMSVGSGALSAISEDNAATDYAHVFYESHGDGFPSQARSLSGPSLEDVPPPIYYPDLVFEGAEAAAAFSAVGAAFLQEHQQPSFASQPAPVFYNDVDLATAHVAALDVSRQDSTIPPSLWNSNHQPKQKPVSVALESVPQPTFYDDVVYTTDTKLEDRLDAANIPANPPVFLTNGNIIGTEDITEQDVLVADGEEFENHTGNQMYCTEVENRRARFAAASETEKLAIRLDLMNCIKRNGGRFLKRDKKETSRWKVMDPKAVRTKATKDLSGIANTAKCYIEGDVRETDVLMGRGAHGVHHPGNQAYLRERDRLRPAYLNARTDEEKHVIGQDLVHWVQARGGRFLKQDTDKKWYSMDRETVYEAALQKLREDRRVTPTGS
jgi:hypothetical protein